MSGVLVERPKAIEGELLLRRDRRSYDDRFGVGDYVSRDGNDVHRVLDINESGDLCTVICIVEPPIYDGSNEPWTRVGDIDDNLTRRYSKIDFVLQEGG